ncbi:hypothetical protein WJX72_001795 [[Myrmecia] bisecta]|uniref:S-adenosyl-L-methionine-dependent methyltransferase n=1 Tax=[Myrmecia] bisecta TaxID=41462 RepID=A0AAW1PL26_9CHLO
MSDRKGLAVVSKPRVGSGFVSFTSLLVAGFRALENERPDGILNDPIARALIGDSKKLQDALAQAQEWILVQEEEEKAHICNSTVMRAHYLDEQLVAALQRLAGTGPVQEGHSQAVHSQVVLLGAGLDTRPWRLPIPPWVSWFEVDKQDVLTMKQQRLQQAGVGFLAQPVIAEQAAYPLQAASWQGVDADLADAGWVSSLIKAGFEPSLPTVWIAEGLIYYLTPDVAIELHKAVRRVSAPGSLFMASNMDK